MTTRTNRTMRDESFDEILRGTIIKANQQNRPVLNLAEAILEVFQSRELRKRIRSEVFLFNIGYNSKDRGDGMWDYDHRSNMRSSWTLGRYEQVKESEFGDLYREDQVYGSLCERFGEDWIKRSPLVLRKHLSYVSKVSDGRCNTPKYIALPGLTAREPETYDAIRELAIGKNDHKEQIMTYYPVDRDADEWKTLKGVITPETFKKLVVFAVERNALV